MTRTTVRIAGQAMRPGPRGRAVLAALGLAALGPASGCRASERARAEPTTESTASARTSRPYQREPRPTRAAPEALPELGASAPLTPDERKELGLLLDARDFGGLAVGAGGNPTDELRAFRSTLARPTAAALFAHAVTHGSPEGKAWGMAGLYLVDRARFELELERLRGSDELVNVWMSGCGGGLPKTLGALLEHPDAPWLEGPSDTPRAYYQRHGLTQDLEEDIAGGFLPFRLSGRGARP